MPKIAQTTIQGEEVPEGSENNSDDSSTSLENVDEVPKTSTNRRFLPPRHSKGSSLNKVALRGIKKPEKRLKNRMNLKPNEIKRLYTKQNLNSFRPSSLETIFEDDHEDDEVEDVDTTIEMDSPQTENKPKTPIFGKKKLKRTLNCVDGLNINKTLLKKRRTKIRSVLGKKFSLKKIPVQQFFDYLKSTPLFQNQNSEANVKPSGEAKPCNEAESLDSNDSAKEEESFEETDSPSEVEASPNVLDEEETIAEDTLPTPPSSAHLAESIA